MSKQPLTTYPKDRYHTLPATRMDDVTTINGVSNQITIAEGANIVVTTNTATNTITIASTASGKSLEKTETVTSGAMTVAAIGAAGLQVGSLIANQGTDGTKECHISLNPNINNTGAIYISTEATRPATLLNPLYPDQLPTYVFNGANSAYLYADSAGDSVDLVLEYWV